MQFRTTTTAVGVLLAATLFCGHLADANAAEKPVVAEHNPPGDIPDTQVFVAYESSLGFTIKVPEGWSRAEGAKSVRFSEPPLSGRTQTHAAAP